MSRRSTGVEQTLGVAVATAIGAAIIVALGMLFLGVPVKAHAQSARCQGPELLVTYYGKDDAAAFAFDRAKDVAGIMAGLVALAGPSPAASVLIMLGLDLNTGGADFFLFNGDGCRIAHLGPMPASEAIGLLTAASIDLPPAIALPGGRTPASGSMPPTVQGLIEARYVQPADDKFTDPGTAQWFQSLTTFSADQAKNVGCCDQSDCRQTKAVFMDGHWVADSVLHPGQKVIVPDNRVLKEPNPLLNAVLCEASGYTSEFEVDTIPDGRADYVVCFVAPPLGF